jgi:hypothetical protein
MISQAEKPQTTDNRQRASASDAPEKPQTTSNTVTSNDQPAFRAG